MRSAQGISRSGTRLFLWALVAVALVLRVAWLGRASYMIDEILVVRDAAAQQSLTQVYQTEVQRFNVMHRLPLLMMILHLAARLAGTMGRLTPEWITRLPFALFGAAGIPMLYLLGRDSRGRTAGLWAAFLGTVSVFHIFYSREAYDYSMLVFFTTGVLWAGLWMVRDLVQEGVFRWKHALLYVLFSLGLSQSHLSGMFFLPTWNAFMALAVFLKAPPAAWRRARVIGAWLLCLAAAYVVFLPFLLRLGGYSSPEHATVRRFSLTVIRSLLGRMGWGEGWGVWLAFGALLVAGWVRDLRKRGAGAGSGRWILPAQAMAYLAIQSFTLKWGRYEVRYYAALFPLLIVGVAGGLDAAVSRLATRLPRLRQAVVHGLLGTILLAWLAPSLWAVTRLECRGYNFKGLARWIVQNVPPNGIAAFANPYELRGVPSAYPAEGRAVTCAAAWNDQERARHPERLLSFFERFPLACLVEICPAFLSGGRIEDDLPRSQFTFRHQVWLEDPAYRTLVRLKTLPLGDAQWFSEQLDKILIQYNRLEDLREIAARRGRKFYHVWGPQWQYHVDQQATDWSVLVRAGTLNIGNTAGGPAVASVVLKAAAPAPGCRFSVYGADGSKVLDAAEAGPVARDVTIPSVRLGPGLNGLYLEVMPVQYNQPVPLLVYGVGFTEP